MEISEDSFSNQNSNTVSVQESQSDSQMVQEVSSIYEDPLYWGVLKNSKDPLKDFLLSKQEYSLGNSSESDLQVKEKEIGSPHLSISLDPYTKQVKIKLLWREGFLKVKNWTSKIAIFGKPISIVNGDQIVFGGYSDMRKEIAYHFYINEAILNVIFHDENSFQKVLKKGIPNEDIIKKQLKSHYSCSICLELMVNVVTLIPCLHDFCGVCITHHMNTNSIDTSCPLCRIQIHSAKRNDRINSFLRDHITREVSELKRQRIEKMDYFKDHSEKILVRSTTTSRNNSLEV